MGLKNAIHFMGYNQSCYHVSNWDWHCVMWLSNYAYACKRSKLNIHGTTKVHLNGGFMFGDATKVF